MASAQDYRLYQHSGKLGFSPFLLALIGIPVIIALSFIYSYLVVYIPLAGYVTFLLLAGYAFALSFTMSILARAGKCRNESALKIFNVVGGVIALYFTWVAFVFALINRFGSEEPVSLLALTFDPLLLWNYILLINEYGWYSLKGLTPTGIILWIFWAIEAAVILGAPFLLPTSTLADDMFCENCRRWCDASATKFRSLPSEMESCRINEINSNILATHAELTEKAVPCIKEEMLQCAGCGKTKGLRFSRITHKVDKDGSLNENPETVKGIVLANQF